MPPRNPPFQSKYSHHFSATYLDNLRNNRPARPTGSRPAPFSPRKYGSLASQSSLTRSDSAPTVSAHQQDDTEQEDQPVHPGMQKSLSFSSSLKGRPLAQPPGTEPQVRGRKFSPTATVQVSDQTTVGYVESEARKLEKEE